MKVPVEGFPRCHRSGSAGRVHYLWIDFLNLCALFKPAPGIGSPSPRKWATSIRMRSSKLLQLASKTAAPVYLWNVIPISLSPCEAQQTLICLSGGWPSILVILYWLTEGPGLMALNTHLYIVALGSRKNAFSPRRVLHFGASLCFGSFLSARCAKVFPAAHINPLQAWCPSRIRRILSSARAGHFIKTRPTGLGLPNYTATAFLRSSRQDDRDLRASAQAASGIRGTLGHICSRSVPRKSCFTIDMVRKTTQ